MKKYISITLLITTMLFSIHSYSQKKITFSVKGVSFDIVFVEGGTFIMGCTEEQTDCKTDEKPTHEVTLSDFGIGRFQVTQSLWKAVMGTTINEQALKAKENMIDAHLVAFFMNELDVPNSAFLPFTDIDYPMEFAKEYTRTLNSFGKILHFSRENTGHPMCFLNYNDCEEFCRRLNRLLFNYLPEGYKFVMPTEAQWEYAARGGNKSKGYIFSGSNNIDDVAWYNKPVDGFLLTEVDGKTGIVGTKAPNELLIYDMSGNVWEWCKDWYDENYYQNTPSQDPDRPSSEKFRVLRGGSFHSEMQSCRVSNRMYQNPNERNSKCGFRLVLEIPPIDSLSKIPENLENPNFSEDNFRKNYYAATKSLTPTRHIFTVNNTSFEMIYMENGTFIMGCNSDSKDCKTNEKPAHEVTLSDYYLGKFPVTQKLWYEVMGVTIEEQRKVAYKNFTLFGVGDYYPMYYINYYECEEFCKKLNYLLTDKLPKGYKFAIPTEAQWEYAAKGGSKSKGYTFSGSNDLNNVGWFSSNSKETQEVGIKNRNELGFCDMSGNIWEWCSDWFGYYYYRESLPNDPKGPVSGTQHVLRGGSWNDNEKSCRITCRNNYKSDFRYYNHGFRLALVKEE